MFLQMACVIFAFVVAVWFFKYDFIIGAGKQQRNHRTEINMCDVGLSVTNDALFL